MAHIAIRNKGDIYCHIHTSEKLISECEDCKNLVCSTCMTSSDHRRHAFRALKVVADEKARTIKHVADSIDIEKVPKAQEEIKSVEKGIQEIENYYGNEIQKVKDQCEELKHQLDNLADSKITMLKTDCTNLKEEMENYNKTMKKKIQELGKLSKDFQDILSSESDVLVYDTEPNIDLNADMPTFPHIDVLRFLPNQELKTYIEEAFGDLAKVSLEDMNGLGDLGVQLSSLELGTRTTNTAAISNKLLEHPDTVSAFTIPFKPKCICVLYGDLGIAYFSKEDSPIICKTDRAGVIRNELLCDVTIKNLFAKNTQRVFYCCTTNNMNVLQVDEYAGITRKAFSLHFQPSHIYITSDDILVASSNQEVKIIKSGKELMSYTLPNQPCSISMDKNDRYLAAACKYSGVLVFDTYMYRKTDIYTYLNNSTHGDDQRFYCSCAIFDTDCNLLVADYWNSKIHIVDGLAGTIKKIIQPMGMWYPEVIALQENGQRLWIGCNLQENNVLFVKYRKYEEDEGQYGQLAEQQN